MLECSTKGNSPHYYFLFFFSFQSDHSLALTYCILLSFLTGSSRSFNARSTHLANNNIIDHWDLHRPRVGKLATLISRTAPLDSNASFSSISIHLIRRSGLASPEQNYLDQERATTQIEINSRQQV